MTRSLITFHRRHVRFFACMYIHDREMKLRHDVIYRYQFNSGRKAQFDPRLFVVNCVNSKNDVGHLHLPFDKSPIYVNKLRPHLST